MSIQSVLPLVHVSPETAYMIESYPYGRLRCKRRVWLETKKNKGTRFGAQTTNPKHPGDSWNKPHYSTYSDISAALYLDEKGYVQWAGVGNYSDAPTLREYLDTFGENATNFEYLSRWTAAMELKEKKMKEAGNPSYGSPEFATLHKEIMPLVYKIMKGELAV